MSPVSRARALSVRGKLRLWGLVADVALAVASYEVATFVFAWLHSVAYHIGARAFDWDLEVTVVAVVASFSQCGLYKSEAQASLL